MPVPHSSRQHEDVVLEPIAVCGMSCRLPGAVDSPSSLWEMLVNKGSGQTPRVPSTRFNIDAHYHANLERPGSFNVLGGYFLDEDVRNFDPTFFNMTPVEAMWLDPQQRKILEVCYEVLENSGRTLESVSGSNTAVFVGCFTADYQQMSTKDPDFRHNYAATGVDPGLISNRVGNMFNLKGPSFTINTACSSSIYATHMACNALRARDCEAAIVAGVNLILTVDQHMNTAKLGILSPTSTCHTFDISADGYGRAEGAGALYLKRLSDAIRDGDPVRGVLRSSAVNTNGKVPGMGITHPSGRDQERAVRMAYERAKLDPNKTAYVETHGTGTPVGDPIEVRAVARAMNDHRSKDKPLVVGALKPNIGHSEAASGIFAIIKAALMTEFGIIPGVRGLTTLNPAIHADEWNVRIPANTIEWPKGFEGRRASVSSFGYGGTNGHVILEDVNTLYPFYVHGAQKSRGTYDHSTKRPLLLCFSAHDQTTLARNINAHAAVASKYYLADLAYTINTRRTLFAARGFTIATEASVETDMDLASFTTATASLESPQLGFIFTGQGTQWARMGADAFEQFPVFREAIRHLDLVLKACPHPPSWTLEQILSEPADVSRLQVAEFAQPALTAIQIALVDLFASWSIFPTAVVGHSSGEMAAAYAAGLTSAPEAMLAAYYRGFSLAAHGPSGGAMLAVGLGPDEAASTIAEVGCAVEIACENSPSSVTLSGPAEAIKKFKYHLDGRGVFARELSTGQAYHSSAMASVAGPFEQYLSNACARLDDDSRYWCQSVARMFSSVKATEITALDISPSYWADNLISRVRFREAVGLLGNTPGLSTISVMVEIGPHAALAGPFKQICQANKWDHFSHVASLVRNGDGTTNLLQTAGQLFLRNYPVDFEAVNTVESASQEIIRGINKLIRPRLLVDLPPYSWNYERMYWTEPRSSHHQRQLTHLRHDILGSSIVGLSDTSLVWRNVLRHKDIPWLVDHSLGGSAIFPAAGHLSLAIEAVRQMCDKKGLIVSGVTLRDVLIKTALIIPEKDDGIEIQVRITDARSKSSSSTNAPPTYRFTVESLTDADEWVLHCEGTVTPLFNVSGSSSTGDHPVDKSRLTQRVPSSRWYEAISRVGFDYGPSFQQLGLVRTNNQLHEAAANVTITTSSGLMLDESRYILHPSTVDACLQLIIISIHAGKHKEMPWGVVPIGIEEVSLYFSSSSENVQGSAVAWTDNLDGRYFRTHTRLVTPSGKLVLSITNLRCVAYEAAIPQNAQQAIPRQPYAAVTWKPDVTALTSDTVAQLWSDVKTSQQVIEKAVELIDHKSPVKNAVVLGFSDEKMCEALTNSLPVGTSIQTVAFTDLAALSAETATANLVVVSEEVMKDESLDTVFGQIRSVLNIPSGKLLLISRIGEAESAKKNLSIAGLATPVSLFTDKEVTIFLSGAESDTEELVVQEKIKLTLVVNDPEDAKLAALAHVLVDSAVVQIQPLYDYHSTDNEAVMVVDLDGKLLSNLDDTSFSGLKELLCSGNKTIWLTAGVNSGDNPLGAMSQGLLRTLRAEQSNARVTHLDVDQESDIEIIAAKALERLRTASLLSSEADTEFWLHDKILNVNRIVPNQTLNAQFNIDKEPAPIATLQPLDTLLGNVVDGKIVFTPVRCEDLEDSEVKIQVDCFATEESRSEAFMRVPNIVAGRVVEVKDGLPLSLLEKNVLAYSSEHFKTFLCAQVGEVVTTGQNSVEALLAVVPDMCKAVNSIGISRLQVNQNIVLIQPSTTTFTAFTRLSEALGFTLMTVESIERFRKLVLESRPSRKSLTVIAHEFSSLSQEIWRSMPPMSRFVLNESVALDSPDPLPFAKGMLFECTSLANLYNQSPSALTSVLQKTVDIVVAHPDWLSSTPAVIDISDALSATTPGQIVKFHYGQSVISRRPANPQLHLSPSANYLLVGCLGGLGRSLTTFMMDHGARNFVFLSRSGADKPEASLLVDSLITAGASVQVFRADASNDADVVRVVEEVTATGPPIKGVVHAAMVLQDAMFGATMTLSRFQAAIAPKVQGAQALHNAVKNLDLDFFVMTSSVSGTIGNPGQTNYGAANSYLDAFAVQRHRLGLPATSLVLPMVLDVGVVAETEDLESKITRKGWYGIDEREMLKGFEMAMLQTPPSANSSSTTPQIVLGVEPQFFASAISAAPDWNDIYWLSDSRFSHVRRSVDAITASASGCGKKTGGNGEIMGLVAAARQEAAVSGGDVTDVTVKVIADHLIKKCSSILMVPVERFSIDSGSVASYGLDSMIGAELRNWLFREFNLDISFQDLLAGSLTFRKLGVIVCKAMKLIEESE